ncbi:MAG: LTA synthase family protein [candidate division Zixibacteria bacterium]|nr:LTA synthase family protein [candidate division Zixibacteria bacterium]
MPARFTTGPFAKELVFFTKCFLAAMATFSLFRLLFLVVYSGEFAGVPLFEVLRGFIHGLRFDAAIVSMGFAGVLVLSLIPGINRYRWFRYLWIALAYAAFVFFFLLMLADLQYFEHSKKRLGYEAFAYLDSTGWPVLKTAVSQHPWYLILGAAALTFFFVFTIRHLRRTRILAYKPIPLATYLLVLFVLAPLLFLFSRGGWQRVPLRTADSFISSYNAVNILTVNSPHMALRNLGKSQPPRLMEAARAEELCLSLLEVDSLSQIDPEYPLLVRTSDALSGTPEKYNVVVFLMESWTGKFAGPDSETPQVTPVFNSLAAEGRYFPRFFASGFRSSSGLFSVLTGIPDQVGLPVMRRQELQDTFASLSVLLKRRGYCSIFVHGGLLDFDNLENMLVHEGFDIIIGKDELSDCGGPEHTWGYDDEFAFARAHEEFKKQGENPFLGFVFSVTNHAPYELPDERHYIFDEDDHQQFRFLNAYRYTDYALGEFFELARQEEYFKRTVFIITGDHTHHTNLNIYENQRLPLLIYAPGIVSPGVSSGIGAQTDIPATVAAILKLPHRADMGRDLMSLTDDEGFAYFIAGQSIGWVEGDHIAIMGLDNRLPLVYDYRAGDYSTNRAAVDSGLGIAIRRKADAFYQFGSDLLFHNRIYPPDLAVGREAGM